jgi:predicted NUDIX family NTP pyrophosphohydrolase
MASQVSAGIVLYRWHEGVLEVLLGHPGGPFFRNKDEGAWSIPKGLVDDGESLEAAARREFEEEISYRPKGELLDLGSIRPKSGKTIHIFAGEDDLPAGHRVESNTFAMEWPPRSGRTQEFPEMDGAAFFPLEQARKKINPKQALFLDRLAEALETPHREPEA